MKAWRDDDNKSDNNVTNPAEHTTSSTTISPSKFYKKRNKMKSPEQSELEKLLHKISNSTKTKNIQKCYMEMRNKRIAYKSITSLKKFPLQETAMEYWNTLLVSHLFPKTSDHSPSKDDGDVSTSSLSENTNWQKKRASLDGSPIKVKKALCPKIKEELANGFLIERDMIPPSNFMKDKFESEGETTENKALDPNNDETKPFLPPLWSLEPRIFAMETSSSGKRKYIVGHFGRFIDWYFRKTSPDTRHYYELIPEKTPCRLFFDLEFNKQANEDITTYISEELMDEFIQELIIEIKTVYELCIDKSCIVDLDSTTTKKFSRHLIVHLPNDSLFANATEAGIFVKHFVSRLADEVATNSLNRPFLSNYLFVNKEDSNGKSSVDTTLFVDLGVYTRNRLFRIIGSTKFGKPSSAALRIAERNEFPFPSGFHNHKFYIPEMKKCNENDTDSEEDGKILEVDQFRSAMDWSDHADALASTLVVPLNYSKTNYNILDTSKLTPKSSNIATNSRAGCNKPRVNTCGKNFSSSENRGPSPFPDLDKYITDTLLTIGGVQGQIRCWYINDQYSKNLTVSNQIETITFHINHNRYCENIGRCHKSNGIMWTVDFINMQCYQSCWDPECRAMGFYRSKPVELPYDIQEYARERLFDIEIASIDESAFSQKQEKKETDDEEFEKALLAIDLSGLAVKNGGESKENKESSLEEICKDAKIAKNQEEIDFEEALLKLNI